MVLRLGAPDSLINGPIYETPVVYPHAWCSRRNVFFCMFFFSGSSKPILGPNPPTRLYCPARSGNAWLKTILKKIKTGKCNYTRDPFHQSQENHLFPTHKLSVGDKWETTFDLISKNWEELKIIMMQLLLMKFEVFQNMSHCLWCQKSTKGKEISKLKIKRFLYIQF